MLCHFQGEREREAKLLSTSFFGFSAAPAREEPRRKELCYATLTSKEEKREAELMSTDELSVQYGACSWGAQAQCVVKALMM